MKLVCLLWLACLCQFAFSQGTTAPDFSLPDMNGQDVRLSEQIGDGPIVINFWATWCVPCRSEMKKLKKIYEAYQEEGLTILSVSIDDPKTVGKVKGFINSNRYPFTILMDTNQEVFNLYQGANPPLTILIDQNGQIVYRHTGYRKGDEKKLEEKILPLLKEVEG